MRITVWFAGAAVALTLSACSDDTTPPADTPPSPGVVSTPPEALNPDTSVEPINPQEDPGEQTFDGEGVTTEMIKANEMDIEIPQGLRIPEATLVTEATKSSIMMADEDPAAVTAMVDSSAEEAGYEVYAEVPGGKVLVGHGNAVLFTASPMAQMITWGPEAMKDVLAGN